MHQDQSIEIEIPLYRFISSLPPCFPSSHSIFPPAVNCLPPYLLDFVFGGSMRVYAAYVHNQSSEHQKSASCFGSCWLGCSEVGGNGQKNIPCCGPTTAQQSTPPLFQRRRFVGDLPLVGTNYLPEYPDMSSVLYSSRQKEVSNMPGRR